MDYRSFYRRSIEDRDAFWGEEDARIHWERPFDRVLDASRPPFARWFVGGTTNLCHNAVDRHLATRADQNALIFVSTETGTERCYSFRELHDEVQRMAATLLSLGVRQGDRVLIYMPMIAEAAFAMLACARIGAIHSVVFGGFSAESLRDRLNDAQASVLITADGGYRRGSIVPLKKNVDDALLINGATGSGKEMLAAEIHRHPA
jgi:propionyl-CoA synthetase